MAKKKAATKTEVTSDKTLDVTSIEDAKKKLPGLKVVGDGDTMLLLYKASDESQGWMKSAKALYIKQVGCVVQFTTQQKNIDGTYSVAETSSFVPGVKPIDDQDNPGGRKLVPLNYAG